jgi:hypothetical protein
VASYKTAAAVATWKAIESAFGSEIHVRTVNTHIALATTQKGNLSIIGYVNKMSVLGEEMDATGKPLDEEEMIYYILAGLDLEYNSVVLAIVTRIEPISVHESYGQLLSIELQQVLLQGSSKTSSANAAMRGLGGFGRDHDDGCGRSEGRTGNTKPPNNYNNNRNCNSKHPTCQVCEKEGHTAIHC